MSKQQGAKVTDVFRASRAGAAPARGGKARGPQAAAPPAPAAAQAEPQLPQDQQQAEADEATLRQFDLDTRCAGGLRRNLCGMLVGPGRLSEARRCPGAARLTSCASCPPIPTPYPASLRRFGPCTGITRLQRYERAVRLGLDPPPEVPQLVARHGADSQFNANVFAPNKGP